MCYGNITINIALSQHHMVKYVGIYFFTDTLLFEFMILLRHMILYSINIFLGMHLKVYNIYQGMILSIFCKVQLS